MKFSWLKGHGTQNDFVLIDDPDGALDLKPDFVAKLCDRRAGIGADGVLRVVRGEVMGSTASWFMDYRNADGSVSEMCGNGIRVFARFLFDEGRAESPMQIGTRAGIKTVFVDDDLISVDMGVPEVGGVSQVQVDHFVFEAKEIRTGNPHAVVFVDDLNQAGSLQVAPSVDESVYPGGANVEFVTRIGPQHLAMRVHERGSGETKSCGTGACAAAVAAMKTAGAQGKYRVDVPGGTLFVVWAEDESMTLIGPAEIVARGTMEWLA